MQSVPIPPQALLQHAGFLRRLAVDLLGEGPDAEDAVQETWLAAMQHPPVCGLRSWIATTVTRAAARLSRSRRRRAARETLAARPEAVVQADRAPRVQAMRRVAEAVAALPAQQRDVVVLRYQHGLSLAQVAATLQTSTVAVKSRLRRALETLRARLGDADASAWRGGLAGALAIPRPRCSSLAGVLMGAKAGAVGLALGALLAMLLWWAWPRHAPDTPVRAAPAAASPIGEDGGRRIAASADPETAGAARAPVSAPAPMTTLAGRVVDERRFPVAGAHVWLQRDEVVGDLVVSESDGTFRVPLAPVSSGTVAVCATDGARAAIEPLFEDAVDAGVLVLVATGTCTLRVERAALAVPGAEAIAAPTFLPARARRWRARTDAQGSCHWDGLPPGVYVVDVRDAGGDRATVEIEVSGGRETTAVVDLEATHAAVVEVLAEDGAPLEGATVDAWLAIALQGGSVARHALHDAWPLAATDAAGRVRLPGRVGEGLHVTATAAGLASGQGDVEVGGPPLRLTLHGAPAPMRFPCALADAPPPGCVLRAAEARCDPEAAELHATRGEDGWLEITRQDAAPRWPLFVFDAGGARVARLEGEGSTATFRPTRTLTVRVRSAHGLALPDWPIVVQGRPRARRTDRDGTVAFEGFFGGTAEVWLDDQPGVITGDEVLLGVGELESGDATLDVVRAPAIRLVARVFVDGEPRLPPRVDLRARNAWASDIVEHPGAGRLTFALWPHAAADPIELLLYGPWDHSIATATLPAPHHAERTVDLLLERRASVRVRVVPPADGRYALWLERESSPGAWNIWTHAEAGPTLRARGQRFDNLRPGRYRCRDPLSDTTNTAFEVRVGAPEATVVLDLAGVATVRGRVRATPGEDVTGFRLTVDGLAHEARTLPDDGFEVRVSFAAPRTIAVEHARLAPDPRSGSVTLHAARDDLELWLVPR